MALPRPPEPVKLICGVLCSDLSVWQGVATYLADWFSPIEQETPWWPFEYTHYYDAQMGIPIRRRFLAFRDLVDPDQLAPIKVRTNLLEEWAAAGHPSGKRVINLDPGWIHTGQLVLASAKPASYRIYLGEGIYAELELWYRNGAWQPLPWTYPDYRVPDYLRFFSDVRRRYLEQRRQWLKQRTGPHHP